MPFRIVLALSVALGLLPAAYAFEAASDQPIHIKADRARLDDTKGLATYSGNVEVSQGQTRLQADTVVVHRDNKKELSLIEAHGEPASYAQAATPDIPETKAFAKTITYDRTQEKLTLRSDARLEQSGNVFTGETIDYDTVKRLVTASGASEGKADGRVEMIIQPPTREPKDTQP